MMVKSSKETIARVNATRRHSLVLKAISHEEEESSDDGASTYEPSQKEKRKSHSESLALADHNWWKKGDFRSNATKNKRKEGSSTRKARN